LPDDAPYLRGTQRAALVDAIREHWERTRTPDAPRDVAVAEAVAFLATLFAKPPPVAA
jgi:hypothetical protein